MWKSEGSEFQTKIGQMENWWLQLFENILEFVHMWLPPTRPTGNRNQMETVSINWLQLCA